MAPGTSTPEKTAPGALELVQRFVNSIDLESGDDRQQPRDRAVHAARLRRQLRVRAGREHHPHPGPGRRSVEPRHALLVERHPVVGHQQRAQAFAHVDRAV